MKMILALAAGYVLGASAGSRDFEELLDSVRAIRDSEEFNDFLAALRSHASAMANSQRSVRVASATISVSGPPARAKHQVVRGFRSR
jgi:hypothetical protein